MATTQFRQHAIGIFSNRGAAEHALRELRAAGFPMDQVSILAKDTDGNEKIAGVETQETTGNKADEGAKAGAITGGIGGAIVGALEALGFATFIPLLFPGGQILAFGTVAANAFATAVAGGAIGAAGGGLLGGLIGWGVPEKRAKVYQDRLGAGDYLVMVEGDEAEIRRAESIFSPQGIQEWGVYEAPQPTVHR